MAHVPTRTGGRGCPSPVRSWQVQSSAVVGGDGSVISSPDYRAGGWIDAPARSTVMAALLESGRLGDVCYSTRLRDEVDRAAFEVPWWFRAVFRVPAGTGGHLAVRSDGIIHRADLFVNGAPVAGREVIAGAYTSNCFDVTALLRRSDNVLAYLVHPGSPMTDLSIGWVDWNQWPPDNNMGIWRDVVLLPTGPVRLAHPRVTVSLSGALDEARLVVTCEALALEEAALPEVVMRIAGPTGVIELRGERQPGGAGPGGASPQAVEYRAEAVLPHPAVWWPAALGPQPLYDLEVVALVDGETSDRAASSFGIRSVTSELAPGGGRWFSVNGRRVPIRGAGWAPDIFLRHDPQRIADELSYTLEAGLNTIRLEGKGENPEFFEAADEAGVLVLPGWECCNKWEAYAGTGGAAWDEHDFDVARRSMEAEAFHLGNHPCVLGFVIGSDFPPEPRATRGYLEALSRARWDLPVISSATVAGTEEAGPSGMKMTGPYSWVPPSYWYRDDLGGAVGFNSETSAGNNVPRLPSLRRMLSPEELEELWRDPAAKQFHAGPPSAFDNLQIFHEALAARYGRPRSLRDFVAKAQLASYEATRAQFEAYGGRSGRPEPATGVIYWMLNSAWPSLGWQLWDHFLDPAAAFFGTKKANEPLHVQYDYAEEVAKVVNRTSEAAGPFAVTVTLRTVGGAVADRRTSGIGTVPPGEIVVVPGPPLRPPGLSGTWFAELELAGAAGHETVSRNVYWLSTVPDVLDLEATTWQYTPTVGFADLRGLEGLGAPRLEAEARASEASGRGSTTVTITNASPDGTPAVGVHASLESAAGAPVVPVLWSENDLTLFAGESATIAARYPVSSLGGDRPVVELDAFNLAAPVHVEVVGAARPPAET